MCKLELKNKWLLLKNWTIAIFGTFSYIALLFLQRLPTQIKTSFSLTNIEWKKVQQIIIRNNQIRKEPNQKKTTNCNLVLLLRRFAKEKSSLLFISHLKTGLNVGEIWHQSRRSSGIIWNNLMKCIGNTYYEIHYILDPWSIRNFVEADRDRVKENQEKTKYHW